MLAPAFLLSEAQSKGTSPAALVIGVVVAAAAFIGFVLSARKSRRSHVGHAARNREVHPRSFEVYSLVVGGVILVAVLLAIFVIPDRWKAFFSFVILLFALVSAVVGRWLHKKEKAAWIDVDRDSRRL
jgi:protein-S-isoprenylcysteine O-methyltransferase Ste14